MILCGVGWSESLQGGVAEGLALSHSYAIAFLLIDTSSVRRCEQESAQLTRQVVIKALVQFAQSTKEADT